MQLPPLSRSPFRRQPDDMTRRFDAWLESEAGQAVLDAERTMLADWLPKLVGQRAMEISGGRGRDMLAGIRLPWRCAVNPVHLGGGPEPAAEDDHGTRPVRLEACPWPCRWPRTASTWCCCITAWNSRTIPIRCCAKRPAASPRAG